jgi:hypothetical protein
VFKTVVDRLDEYDGASLVVTLGRTQPMPSLPRGKKLGFLTVSEQALQVIAGLDPALLKDGVTLVISSESYRTQGRRIDAAQRRLAYIYAKYIVFPQKSDTIPNDLGLRKDNGFTLLRQIVSARNFPLHARFPICDKLVDAHIGLPVTIVAPGPSLQYVIPQWDEIHRRSLVVCMARTLPFLRRAGLEPDFAIMFDSSQRMVHLMPCEERWPRTYLVSMSNANIADVAENFRGVFFMESFDTALCPNTYRLRESWLSGIISCLGLAEALAAPEVYMVGADHCWYDSERGAYGSMGYGQTPSPPFPEATPTAVCNLQSATITDRRQLQFDQFKLPDVCGRAATTSFHYYAIAAEVGFVAAEIRDRSGTHFHLLNRVGILDSEVFNMEGWDHLRSRYQALDRAGTRDAIDDILCQREHVDFGEMVRRSEQLAGGVQAEICRMEYELVVGRVGDVVQSEFAASLHRAQSYNKFPTLSSEKALAETTVRVLREWERRLREAAAHGRLFAMLEAGTPLPLLHLAGERIEVTTRALARYAVPFPPVTFDFHVFFIYQMTAVEPGLAYVDYFDLVTFLEQHRVTLISRRLLREYNYLFNQIPVGTFLPI